MRIGIDARELTGQPTGVGRVLAGLLEVWPEDDEIILYAQKPVPSQFLSVGHRRNIVAGSHMPGAIWEQTVLPSRLRRDDVEALFSPAYGMPAAAPCGVVVGMHDCACAATPWEFGWRERKRRQWAARNAAKHAKYLLTGSHFSAHEIRRWYGVRRERIVVAKYGIGKDFGVADVDNVARVRERYALDSASVLFVGTPLVRRNLSALSRAIDEIRSILPDVGLYGVGPETKKVGSVNNLRWLGYVPEEDLAAVYNAATVVAYPSTYEGFGFPVLEALACGTPVVASAAGSLPEIFAGKAWLVDDRHEQWVEALGTLLKDANERQRRIDKAQPWALAQTWDATGRVVHRLLRDASQENGNYSR
tara:strand:- start:809 stop:1894 length:1086 start_codon:yes stop_codon:yes gene_type:complete